MKPKSKQNSHLMYTIHLLYTHFAVQFWPHEVKLRHCAYAHKVLATGAVISDTVLKYLKTDQVSFENISLWTLLLCFLTGIVSEVLNPGVEQFINIVLLKHFMYAYSIFSTHPWSLLIRYHSNLSHLNIRNTHKWV